MFWNINDVGFRLDFFVENSAHTINYLCVILYFYFNNLVYLKLSHFTSIDKHIGSNLI